jgi:hypothetical protein
MATKKLKLLLVNQPKCQGALIFSWCSSKHFPDQKLSPSPLYYYIVYNLTKIKIKLEILSGLRQALSRPPA